MALLGRHKDPCLICKFPHPHIKQNEGKRPYWHCPDCGSLLPTKNRAQTEGLLAGMIPEGATHAAAPAGKIPEPPKADRPIIVPRDAAPAVIAPAAPPASPAPAAPPPKPAGLWDALMSKG